jgi:hypothetical protein
MLTGMEHLVLKRQEVPLDDPRSRYLFRPGPEKPFVATSAAIEAHRQEVILRCLRLLQEQAELHRGLDYLQIFQNSRPGGEDLWFIEDDAGGAITALLPSDY